jgi:hypothetical protein
MLVTICLVKFVTFISYMQMCLPITHTGLLLIQINFFGSFEFRTQGFALASLLPLRPHPAVLFALVIFQIGVSHFCLGLPSDHSLPDYALWLELQARTTTPDLFFHFFIIILLLYCGVYVQRF